MPALCVDSLELYGDRQLDLYHMRPDIAQQLVWLKSQVFGGGQAKANFFVVCTENPHSWLSIALNAPRF